MDVIFHRNCLDGAYSAYLMYLFARTLTPGAYTRLVEHLGQHTGNELQEFTFMGEGLQQVAQLNEDFFHEKGQVHFHCVSMFAGDLFPVYPSAQGNILFLVDISPSTGQLTALLAERFRYVVVFDHHATFSKTQHYVAESKLKNVLYLWDQTKCASSIIFDYLLRGFGFPGNYPPRFQQQLTQVIKMVEANDLKENEDTQSKSFVLGFYYFEIELNHQNPLLFKRLWGLNLEILLSKGQNLYKIHLQLLRKQLQLCTYFRVVKGKFKNTVLLCSQTKDKGVLSDLGCLLAYCCLKNGHDNLAMIVNKSHTVTRVSFRSYKHTNKDPMALKLAQYFEGGGHPCAAGCAVPTNAFKSHFKYESHPKPPLLLSLQQIQSILYKKGEQ